MLNCLLPGVYHGELVVVLTSKQSVLWKIKLERVDKRLPLKIWVTFSEFLLKFKFYPVIFIHLQIDSFKDILTLTGFFVDRL